MWTLPASSKELWPLEPQSRQAESVTMPWVRPPPWGPGGWVLNQGSFKGGCKGEGLEIALGLFTWCLAGSLLVGQNCGN